MTMTTASQGGHGHLKGHCQKRLSSVVVSAQGLNETVGGGLHVDEVAAQGAGAVEHEHNHCALVFVDDFGVTRRCELTVGLPLADRFNPVPLLHIVGTHLIAAQVGEVPEREHIENAFC